jgi:hypothetical protein
MPEIWPNVENPFYTSAANEGRCFETLIPANRKLARGWHSQAKDKVAFEGKVPLMTHSGELRNEANI